MKTPSEIAQAQPPRCIDLPQERHISDNYHTAYDRQQPGQQQPETSRFYLSWSDGSDNCDDGDGDGDVQKKLDLYRLLSQALNGLTPKERQEQQEMLHGVADTMTEEPTFVQLALESLNVELKQTAKLTAAYKTAEKMDPNYVSSRTFRLQFLRCNQYNVKTTADQMLRFFEMKKELFGTSKLVEDITVDDLDEDDIECLKSGCMQLIGNDRSNRPVLLQLPGLKCYKSLKNELRVRYFLSMHML